MITYGGRFSDAYAKEFNIDQTIMTPFFGGPFKNCLVGKADLKEELQKVLVSWKWNGTVEELLQYWFSIGADVHEEVYASISKLREQGLIVCLATNQEKYRTEYLANKLGYRKVFDEIFSSAEIGAYKHSLEGLAAIFQILHDKYAILDKDEVMYWDDREEHVKVLNEQGFNGQLYRDYPSFRATLAESGYQL